MQNRSARSRPRRGLFRTGPHSDGQPPPTAPITAISPSMDKVIVNDVCRAPAAGAPAFYLVPRSDMQES